MADEQVVQAIAAQVMNALPSLLNQLISDAIGREQRPAHSTQSPTGSQHQRSGGGPLRSMSSTQARGSAAPFSSPPPSILASRAVSARNRSNVAINSMLSSSRAVESGNSNSRTAFGNIVQSTNSRVKRIEKI
jgi:hypothetical protein